MDRILLLVPKLSFQRWINKGILEDEFLIAVCINELCSANKEAVWFKVTALVQRRVTADIWNNWWGNCLSCAPSAVTFT